MKEEDKDAITDMLSMVYTLSGIAGALVLPPPAGTSAEDAALLRDTAERFKVNAQAVAAALLCQTCGYDVDTALAKLDAAMARTSAKIKEANPSMSFGAKPEELN